MTAFYTGESNTWQFNGTGAALIRVAQGGNSEEAAAYANEMPAGNSIFSPFAQSELGLSYGNTAWGMTAEEVLAAESLDTADFPLHNRGQNYYMEGTIAGHPEVESVEFEFHFTGLDLALGLDFVQVDYDTDAISYEALLALRKEQLGPPVSTEGNTCHWGTDHVGLTLTLTKNGFLREMCNARDLTSVSYTHLTLPTN